MKRHIFSIIAVTISIFAVMACGFGSKPAETNSKPVETNTKVETKPTETTSDSNKLTNTNSSSTTPTTASSDIAGNYSIEGKSADGKAYQGEIAVTKHDDVYQITWTVASQKYDGVAVQQGNTVAAAYTNGTEGKGCGAVIYKIAADDSLDGKWGVWGVNQTGSEKAVPVGKPTNNSGNFDVSGTNADGTAYKGKLTVTKGGNDVYQFSWDTGIKYIGTGVKMGDYLAVGTGSKQCGFVIYEVKGGNLEGKWGIPGSTALGSEKATKK